MCDTMNTRCINKHVSINTCRTVVPRKRLSRKFTSKCELYSILPAVISSAVASTTCYPLDTYKTRLQTGHVTDKSLYSGYRTSILSCCLTTFVYFSTLKEFTCLMPLGKAAMCASFLTTCIKVPFKCITKLLQNGRFSTIEQIFEFILSKYGIFGFYKSFWIYVLDDVPETVLKFYLFSYIKSVFPENMMMVGTVVGIITAMFTQPMDVLKTILICSAETDESIEYKKINYTRGVLLVMVMNALQSSIFLNTYHFIQSSKFFV